MKPDLKSLNQIEFDADPPEPTVLYKVRYSVLQRSKVSEEHEEFVTAHTEAEALERYGRAFQFDNSVRRIDLIDIEEVK